MYTFNVKKWVYCLFLMICFSTLQLMADDVQKLVISKDDGTEISFLLNENPKIVFSEQLTVENDGWYREVDWVKEVSKWLANEIVNRSLMKITTDNHEIELSTFKLDKMTTININATDITNLGNKKEKVFSWQGDALYVEVLKDCTIIVVYDAGGKKILSKSLDKGKHALSLSDLPKGVNIIKINDEILKILNR